MEPEYAPDKATQTLSLHKPLTGREAEIVPQTVLTDQEVEAMIREVNPKAHLLRKLPFWMSVSLISIIGGLVGGLVGGIGVLLLSAFGLSAFLLLFGFMAWGFYYLYHIVPHRLKKKGRREILNKIEATHDVRFIAPLIDLWAGGKNMNYPLIYEIVQTLTPLLPSLTSENAEALPPKQRKLLYRVLALTPINFSKMQEKVYGELVTDCLVEIIQALTRIGDTGALPTMRSLLKLKGETDWHIRVRGTVQQCLPKLELIAKEETNAKILLRPSTFEDRTGETLLRPISLSQKDNPQTLLRAVDGQEKGEGEEN